MKILFIHQNFPGQFKNFAPALASRGHEVVALTLRDVKPQYWNGVEIVPYKLTRNLSRDIHSWVKEIEIKIVRGAACLQAAINLERRGFTPDLIIAHHGWGESAFLKDLWPGTKLAIYCEYFYSDTGADIGFDKEFPKPSIMMLGDSQEGNGPVRIKNINNLMHFPLADAALSPTVWQANTFPTEIRNKIRVIHDGIDTTKLVPSSDVSLTINNTITITKNDEILTFVNRDLEPMRGYHIFMRSLPIILNTRKSLRVLIVGGNGVSYGAASKDGRSWKDIFIEEVRPKISEKDWQRVHFLGKVPYEQFVKVLQISTVHVYLTYPFVLSWSLLEAMSVGCAIVASDTSPVREFLEDDVTAKLLNFFDIDGLANTVLSLLNDPLTRKKIGMQARASIKERADLSQICLPKQLEWVDSLFH